MSGRTMLAAIVVPAVLGAGLWITAPPPYLVDVPAVSAETAEPPGTSITKTPPLSKFYDVDVETLPEAPPGTLVKAEPVDGGPAGMRVFRIMYHSRDLQGDDLPVSALFLAPSGEPPPGGFPLVAYAHGTTGIGRACGMSQTPFEPLTPGYSHFTRYLEPMVEQGWAVVATDYPGMGAPGPASYLVGPLEARSVLDAMRTVLAPDPKIGSVPINSASLGVYGSSQGGSATLSTLQEAPAYAPELQLKGGVALALGLVAPIPGLLEIVAGNPTSTSQNMFIMLIAKSYADNYPDTVTLDNVLSDEGKARLPLLADHCGDDLAERLTDVPLSALLRQPLDPGLIGALAQGMPGGAPITQPVVIAQGLKDVTILPSFTHAQVMNSCAWGDQVEYATYPHDDHYTIVFTSREQQPRVFSWLNDRFAGRPAASNCANQDRGTP